MSSFWKLSYVVVVDDNEDGEDCAVGEVCHQHHPNFSFSYTLADLQSVLQLAGCKMSHAFKISRRVFDILENEHTQRALRSSVKECSTTSANMLASKAWNNSQNVKLKEPSVEIPECVDSNLSNKSGLFDLYKRQAMVTVKRKKFLDVICSSLTEYHYVGPSQRSDIVLASRIREKKDSVTILLCGTSGCGKSTLSSLLAGRLGITTVVSTDSIRHMMRSFADEKENPLLWASTYHAGEHLDPASVAQAKSKKKDGQSISTPAIGSKIMAIEGYKAQSEMVIDSLDKLITAWEGHKESVIVEGVHLSLNFVMGLMRKHPSIIPFLIYIADEEKHLERFAVRAKYMTLDPKKNKYVKYISNIRTIQDYLCKRADKHLVPKVNNTNVDRSVASIHATIFSCLRKRQTGVGLYDMATNTVKVVSDEYHKHCDTNSVSSKCMFKIIQRQGSSRRLMAIINSDGTVSKAWPFSTEDDIGLCQSNITTVGTALYGPLQIGLSEPVNVQFGNFGIGSWLNSIEGTSCTSSINGSRADGDDSTRYSSCSSSPPHSDGHAKDLIEDDLVVAESEEELFLDTEDSGSDKTEELGEDDLDGSVVESDEELEDDGFAVDMNHLSVYDKSERTLSRTASSRRQDHEHRAYNRSVSLPATKNPSARIKKAKTFKISLDENRDTTN